MTQARLDCWIEELYPQWIAYLRANWKRIRQSLQEEDVAQAVVVALHECRAWERFEGDPENRPHVAGWLLGYVKNMAANWDRYHRRRQAWPLFDTDMRMDPAAESGVPTPTELTRVPSVRRPGRSRVLSTPIERQLEPNLPPWPRSPGEPVGGTRRERAQAKRGWAATQAELDAGERENGESGDTWADAASIHTPTPALHARASEDAILDRLEPALDQLLSRLDDFIVPNLAAPTPAWSREFAKWGEWELRMLLVGWFELRRAIRRGLALSGLARADAEFVLELDDWFRTHCGFGGAKAPSYDPRDRSLRGGGYELVLPVVTRAQARRLVRQANGNPGALADALAAHYWRRRVGQIRGALKLGIDSVNSSALPRASDLFRAALAE